MARARAPPSHCSPSSPHCWGLPRAPRAGVWLVMGWEGEWTVATGRRWWRGAGTPGAGWGWVPVDAQAAGPGPSPARVRRGPCTGCARAPWATSTASCLYHHIDKSAVANGWTGSGMFSLCCLQLELVLGFPCFPGRGLFLLVEDSALRTAGRPRVQHRRASRRPSPEGPFLGGLCREGYGSPAPRAPYTLTTGAEMVSAGSAGPARAES